MNKIHPTAEFIGDIEIGEGNEILPYTVIIGPVKIGDSNYIGPHVTIGTPGQDTRNPGYDCHDKPIVIGNNNIIREYTAIQKPSYGELTYVGNNVFLMQSVHVPHDAYIDDDVVITPMVVMGGIVKIMKGANLGISSSVHQYSVIGHYSIVGMGSSATKNLKPFARLVPGKEISVNEYAVDKFGFHEFKEEISEYVLADRKPESDPICKIVEEFQAAHLASGRKLYQ